MKIRGKEIAFSVLFVLSHAQWQIVLPAILFISDVVKWSIEFVNFVQTAHETFSLLVGDSDATCSEDENHLNIVADRILHATSDISTHLDKISELLNQRTLELEKMIRRLGLRMDMNNRIHHLITAMGVIDNLYNDMLRPGKNKMKFHGKHLCNFARRLLYTGGDLLTEKVDAMYNIIVPSQSLQTGLLTEIHNDLQDHNNELCGTGHSALDYFHSIYTSLMLVEIKAFVMTAFSHNLLFHFNGTSEQCKYDSENSDDEIEMAREKFSNHLKEYNNKFLKQIKDASKEFRACDRDDEFIRDDTYFELEGAIQAIVYPPSNLLRTMRNEQEVGTPCKDLSGSYGTPGLWCNPTSKFCTTSFARNCEGYNLRCQDFADEMYGCVAKNSSRRYEWIKGELNEDVEALMQKCSHTMKLHPPPYKMWLGKKREKACRCECNDNDVNSRSTHIFNLQWVESDVSKNMVITGIRFIVEYGIMQLQIQQGKLGSNFRVEEGDWKPIKDISEEIRAARIARSLGRKLSEVVENIDYLIVTQTINNAINLDTLQLPHTYVLTGVRFYVPPKHGHRIRRIRIAIKGTKFNHITGKLNEAVPPKIIKSNISKRRKYKYPKMNVNKPKFPTLPKSQPDHYVQIAASDFKYDSGQTTLPYFDAIPLVSSPPSPLGGVGIFHKGNGRFTGFVSLKFISLNYRVYMKRSMDEISQQQDMLPTPAME